MINILITVIKIVFLLGFLIFIHECGHFLIARICKVKVKEFAIGFGPTIWRKQGKETKYAIRLIPLGGFVSMLGEEERSEEEGAFNKASIPKRIAIVAAGGLVNIFFAIIVYFILVSAKGGYISNVIDIVPEDSSASVAGLMADDEILEVNGLKINVKNDLSKALEESKGEPVNVKVNRNGEIAEILVKPLEEKVKSTGIYLSASSNQNQTEIMATDVDSAADKAGLKAGDIIISINGTNVENNREKLLELMQTSTGNLNIKILRQNTEEEINLIPDEESVYYLGITLKEANNNFFSNMKYAVYDTRDFLSSIIENLKMLFSGKINMDQMMGPVGIGSIVSQTNGLYEFIYILALISISLGITNLLPIPALDGGRILLLIIEAIRRKPLDEKVEMNIQLLGFAFLICLSIYVAYNDVLRIF